MKTARRQRCGLAGMVVAALCAAAAGCAADRSIVGAGVVGGLPEARAPIELSRSLDAARPASTPRVTAAVPRKELASQSARSALEPDEWPELEEAELSAGGEPLAAVGGNGHLSNGNGHRSNSNGHGRPSQGWSDVPDEDPYESSTVAGCTLPAVQVPDIPLGGPDVPVPAIVNAAHLAPFFERAAQLMQGWARDHVRIAVYGDSNHTQDHITGQLRRRLQLRYGDAGHGFVALGQPWSHYRHKDVRHEGRSGFEVFAVTTKPTFDNAYGLGGIAAESLWRNAKSWVATADPATSSIGTRVSQVEVFFLRKRWYGPLEIRVDGQRHSMVSTRGPKRALGFHRLELDDGPHELHFVAASAKHPIRLLGAVLEREQPGFVIDSFGVGALNTKSLAREDPEINRAMLRQRDYDLIIFMLGSNDEFTFDEVPAAMAKVIEVHREALPTTPILVVAPPDRGKDKTRAAIHRLVEQRRVIAAEHRCAYWNLWEAMGGEGSMARLKKRGLALFDYVHFNEPGGAYVADRLLYALWRELARHLQAHPEVACNRRVLWSRP